MGRLLGLKGLNVLFMTTKFAALGDAKPRLGKQREGSPGHESGLWHLGFVNPMTADIRWGTALGRLLPEVHHVYPYLRSRLASPCRGSS